MDYLAALFELQALGGEARASHGELQIKPPPDGIPSTLRQRLHIHWAELVRMLSPGRLLSSEEALRLDLVSDPLHAQWLPDRDCWQHLFLAVFNDGGSESPLLHALRCIRLAGASIEWTPQGGRIVPAPDFAGEYEDVRRELLAPYGALLVRILRTVPALEESRPVDIEVVTV